MSSDESSTEEPLSSSGASVQMGVIRSDAGLNISRASDDDSTLSSSAPNLYVSGVEEPSKEDDDQVYIEAIGTVLLKEVRMGNWEAVDAHLSQADSRVVTSLSNYTDSKGRAPLHISSMNNASITELLLRHGADGNALDDHGWSPCHCACSSRSGLKPLVVLLNSPNINPCLRNEDGNTPLHYFVRQHDARTAHEELTMLIRRGRDSLNASNKLGETPLHGAVWMGSKYTAQALIEAGAAVDVQTVRGETPLVWACRSGRHACAMLLLAQGARVVDGKAEAEARRRGHSELAAELNRRARQEELKGALLSLGIEHKWITLLVSEGFDMESVVLADHQHLKDIGIPLGVRLKVISLGSGSNSVRQSSGSGDWSSLSGQSLEQELLSHGVPVVEMRHIIGRGFFSEVRMGSWQCVSVAVKLLLRAPSRRSERQAFSQESAMLAALRHPNIVQLLGVCIRETQYCIVTEYMAGGSLHQLIRSARWVNTASTHYYSIATDVCRGMLYLHSRMPHPILHRDLTTRNVLLDETLTAKIADFGVSREYTPDYVTAPVGALPYLAPEVYLRQSYTVASDVFSFSVVLWEMLSRDNPGGDLSANEWAQRVSQGKRPEFPQDGGWWPPQLETIIREAWDADADARPSFETLIVDIDELMLSDASGGYLLSREHL